MRALRVVGMTPRIAYEDDSVTLWHGRWEDVIGPSGHGLPMGGVDCVLTDPPYGARVHSGHDHGVRKARGLDCDRRTIDYAAWSPADVRGFVAAVSPACRGWMCALTSHDLANAWQEGFLEAGRVEFAPVPCVISGMTVRLGGDGPSSWTVWLMPSRTTEQAKWGALRGAYEGPRERQAVTGGKPLWLMRALVRDYSRPGDLILDPCAGGATTLLAARLEGRRAIGIEMDGDTVEKAVALLKHGRIALKNPSQEMLPL